MPDWLIQVAIVVGAITSCGLLRSAFRDFRELGRRRASVPPPLLVDGRLPPQDYDG